MTADRIIVIGAGIGGLTAAALLAQAGCKVTVLEAQTYPGGSAGTFTNNGYRFEAGATVAGGFQPNGPHALIAEKLNLRWPVHPHDPAWVVHLPGYEIPLTRDNRAVLDVFPETAAFWDEQSRIADLGWSMTASGLPWPPSDLSEVAKLIHTGLRFFPRDLEIVPLALSSAHSWLRRRGLDRNPAFVRFIDAQLLIAAQTTSRFANGVYSATALDLARQGVMHVEGGIGGLAETLVTKIREFGGEVLYRQRVTRIDVRDGRVTGVWTKRGRRGTEEQTIPCDFLLANLTPWSLDELLGESSPAGLKREVASRDYGWGAFALHLGIRDNVLPADWPDHHQILASGEGPLGEGRSVFISLSPRWDASRAPVGMRAATVTTHTDVRQWWGWLAEGEDVYAQKKAEYAERMLALIETVRPGFHAGVELMLPGTPVTYQFYTDRFRGMVGGFPQVSLFKARGPRVGLPNARLVGDSIFPGQSTAGVSLGALRVVNDVLRHLPRQALSSVRTKIEVGADG